MKLNEIISMFCTEFGVEGVRPDANGVYALAVDDMVLSFAESDGMLVTASDVGELPAEGRERLYQLMLTAMHATAVDAAFSLDSDRDTVVLRRSDELSTLTFESFKKRLEKFVNLLEEWRSLFAGFDSLAAALDEEKTRRGEEISWAGLNAEGFMRV